ncbi:hypothetical protein AQUCO_00100017v1 [Aquilegia coerulea]|uniref:Uncharacterized protein n=1 Tax=Aquilegia coerulea TaxID=218851 RepID=A0A2G5F8H6_AQUCA|nr:hypothetical protein AQUCO_00100017v1 [Aquilegia coerulea]
MLLQKHSSPCLRATSNLGLSNQFCTPPWMPTKRHGVLRRRKSSSLLMGVLFPVGGCSHKPPHMKHCL